MSIPCALGREMDGVLTGPGSRSPPRFLQKGALCLRRRVLKALGGSFLLPGLVSLLLNRESVLNTRKCGQEERRLLQRFRRLLRFVPLLRTSGPTKVFESRSLLVRSVTHLDDLELEQRLPP